LFRFSDILGTKTVPGNPNFSEGIVPHVWKGHKDYEWYAYQPTPRDFELIAETVDSYLEMFQAPEQNQGMSQQMR
jgi:hypothetical protein